MELLPHECEFLVDGAVVVRFPDRMVPQSDIRYDYVTRFPRSPIAVHLADLAMDYSNYAMTNFLSRVGSCAGCWPDALGRPTAHLLVDYFKAWDVPAGTSIPGFPH